MAGTGLNHRLVREYLRDLDAELARLLTNRVSKLREQITSQLGEALPPDADDAAVAAALTRLGAPSALAAEALSDVATGPGARRRLSVRARLAGLGRRRQTALGLVLALLVAAVTYVVIVQTAAPLEFSGAAGWWYRTWAGNRARSAW